MILASYNTKSDGVFIAAASSSGRNRIWEFIAG